MISRFDKFIGLFLFIFAICAIALPSFANNLGSLLVSSEARAVKIYLDNIYIGETSVKLDAVQVGDHLITGKVQDEIIFKEAIRIKAGERATVLVPFSKETVDTSPESASLSSKLILEKETPIEEPKKKMGKAAEIQDITGLFKKHSESGMSLFLGYGSISVYEKTGYSHRSSAGISGAFGYDFNILNLKTRLLVEGMFGDKGYALPVIMDFLFSFSGDQYIGLGLGIFLTDLVGGSSSGYRATYGFGPLREDKAFLLEMITDVFSTDQTSRYKFTISGGYRWGI